MSPTAWRIQCTASSSWSWQSRAESISGSYATQNPKIGSQGGAGAYLVPGGLRVEIPGELGGERVGAAVLLLRLRLRARLLRRRPCLGHRSLSAGSRWSGAAGSPRRGGRWDRGGGGARARGRVPPFQIEAGKLSWRWAAALPSFPSFFLYGRNPRNFCYLHLCSWRHHHLDRGTDWVHSLPLS
jgi:hypothetical protein